MCCCRISARSNHGIKESLYHFCFSLHVLCTCLPADQGAHAAGSQLPAERLTPHSARTLRRAGHLEHCCPRASRLNALPGCWAPASCLPLPEFTLKLVETHHVSLLPPKLKFSHSWRTASHYESIKNDLFISQFAFQPKQPILGFPAVVSCAASYLPWLNADNFCPDLFSRLSLFPWAQGFVSICSVLCVQADRADCWFLHQWLFERPPASEQITGSTLSPICLLPGLGDYFPQWTILSLTFLPVRALQPPPRWDTHRPARFSSPALPCPMLWLPPSCP